MNAAAGEAASPRRLGRPRDPAADEAIMAATFDVVVELGFGGFTVEEVAARAGVGKATIYRRWSTKEDLVVAAAERVMIPDVLPDTGTLRGDLIAWYWERYRAKDAETDGRLLGQIIIEATVNPELKKLMRRFQADRRCAIRRLVERAEQRGECGPTESGTIMDLISGALMHQSLFGTAKVRRADVERFVDAALVGHGVDVTPR